MRILFLNPIGALGGAERSLLDILAALRDLEPSWELFLIAGADGALLSEASRLGAHAELMPMPDELLVLGDSAVRAGKFGAAFRTLGRATRAGLGARRYAAEVKARIDKIRPDIVHSNGIKFHLLTRMMRPLKIPVAWHIRDFIGARRFMRWALRWAAPAASIAIANSEAVALDARSVLGRVPVRTLLNCIDTERFSPGPASGERLDALAGFPAVNGEIFRLGLLASFARWKGQDLFLNAAALLKQRAPDLRVRFYIVGGPIYKTQGSQFSVEELRALAEKLSVSDAVGFVPFQDEPRDVYRSLDLVVHASTQPEPFGRTIAEAMACGKPVVASLAGGVGELFRPGVEALGVRPNDAAELARAMETVLRDDTLRGTLGANARAAAVERFSRARVGMELRAIYQALIAK